MRFLAHRLAAGWLWHYFGPPRRLELIPGWFPIERCSQMAPPTTCKDQLGGAVLGRHRTADCVESWPNRWSPKLSQTGGSPAYWSGVSAARGGHAATGACGVGGPAARGIAALESGRVRTYGRAAVVFRVLERSVLTWWRPFRAVGQAVRQPRTGLDELLDASARGSALQAMMGTEHPCAPEYGAVLNKPSRPCSSAGQLTCPVAGEPIDRHQHHRYADRPNHRVRMISGCELARAAEVQRRVRLNLPWAIAFSSSWNSCGQRRPLSATPVLVAYFFDPDVIGTLPDARVPDASVEDRQALLDLVGESGWKNQYAEDETVLLGPRCRQCSLVRPTPSVPVERGAHGVQRNLSPPSQRTSSGSSRSTCSSPAWCARRSTSNRS